MSIAHNKKNDRIEKINIEEDINFAFLWDFSENLNNYSILKWKENDGIEKIYDYVS